MLCQKCDLPAAYEIRRPATSTPDVLCLKHGRELKDKLDRELVTYQSTGVTERPLSDAEALAQLRAGIVPRQLEPREQRATPIPAAAPAAADVVPRSAFERLEVFANELREKLNASREKTELLTHENTRLTGALAAANKRLEGLEVEPLTRVEGLTTPNSPTPKAGGDAPAKPNVLGAPLPAGNVVVDNPPGKPPVR